MSLRRVRYQEETLDVLRAFLADARIKGPREAFEANTRHLPAAIRRDYADLTGSLQDAPSVCLRLPTGGGKTLLAARTIPIAGREFLDQEFPLVLWLVPTTAIREQTYQALTTPGNMHCETMQQLYPGRLRVLKLSDFEQLRPQDLGNRTTILIGTLATARVDKTELRRVYAHNESLEPFFTRIPAGLTLAGDDDEAGEPGKFSLIKLLTFCRPLVIVDEAHNNKSPLSFKVMRRINPSCIIELTATPSEDSNILHHVPASALYEEHMIKLPIELTEHPTWQTAIHQAVQERAKLEELARGEADYLRPIVLIQAENIDKDVTWQVVLDFLEKEEGIAREKIAVATGKEKELEGVDLFSPTCPVEIVITVKALKEGWDCSFAYIFCSVATVHSPTEVEQILGRVLRMPYASRRREPALNRAYAHVSTVSWTNAVGLLRDRLVGMGFDETEAENAIREQRPTLPPQVNLRFGDRDDTAGLPLFDLRVRETPDLSLLDKDEQRYIAATPHEDNTTTLHVDADIPEATLRKVERQLAPKERVQLRESLELRRRQQAREKAPSRKGASFVVPQLCRNVQGEFELLDADAMLSVESWRLDACPADLSPTLFSADEEAKRYELTIEGKKVTQRYLGAQMTLDLASMTDTWTEERLLDWLDSRLQDPANRAHPDIRQPVMRAYIRKTLDYLINTRNVSLAELQWYGYSLAKAIERRIEEHRQAARKKGLQLIMALPETELKTDYTFPFTFSADLYYARNWYKGARRFNKHYFPDIGDMKGEGEEFDCAVALDECTAVDYWVRNLDYGPGCFRLVKAHGYFYPDFVAKLLDGRILVVEYKGEHLEDKASEQEKHDCGRVWESRSHGTALFLWAVKKDEHGRTVSQQLAAKVSGA